MIQDRADTELRKKLVQLGVTMGIQRYVGQSQTEAAHEFADRSLSVVKTVEDRIFKRLQKEREEK